MYGGYEYTPYESNKRNNEYLLHKHYEALKVLPTILTNSGYNTLIADSPHIEHNGNTMQSVFKNIKGLNSQRWHGYIRNNILNENDINQNICFNFSIYSLVKTSPIIFRKMMYDNGNYNYHLKSKIQYDIDWLENFTVLKNLPNLTEIKNDVSKNALILHNYTSHNLQNLPYPDFYPIEDYDKKI